MQLSALIIVDSVIVGKFSTMLMWQSSLMKVLAIIFMFLSIFVGRAEDVVILSDATMSKRGLCIVKCSPVGVSPTVARNILTL